MKKIKSLCGLFMLTLVAGLSFFLVGCDDAVTLTHHEAAPATCEEAGHVEYWENEKTGKLYSDENGKNEITDITTPALGHDYEYSYNSENFKYVGVCSRDQSHTTSIDAGVSVNYAYQIDSATTLEVVLGKESSATVYLRLTEDLNADVVIEKDKDVSLDLYGHKITNASTHTILNKGTLKIQDSSADKTGLVDSVIHKMSALYNEVGANLVIDGGNFTRSLENGKDSESNGGNSYYVILNHGDAIINDGKIYNNGAYSSLVENGWYTPSQNKTSVNSNMTINGGTFEGGLWTIKNDDYGVMTIAGGTFQNKMPGSDVTAASGLVLNWNDLTITGGDFIANDCLYVMINGYKGDETYEKATTVITGGNLSGRITTTIKYGSYTSKDYDKGTFDGELAGDVEIAE